MFASFTYATFTDYSIFKNILEQKSVPDQLRVSYISKTRKRNRLGGQVVSRTGGQVVSRTGDQVVSRTGGQVVSRTGG